ICNNRTKSLNNFILDAQKIHGDKFDYSKSNYINNKTNIIIICPKNGHGEFLQRPSHHLSTKISCPKCIDEETRLSVEEFIEKAIKIHKDTYDYSQVIYLGTKEKVIIFCKKVGHGKFYQEPNSHLSNESGCPICRYEDKKISLNEFINRANEIHGINRYDY